MKFNLRSRTRVSLRQIIAGAVASSSLVALVPNAPAAPLFRLENRRENAGAFRLIPELTLMSSKQNYNAAGKKETPGGTDSVSHTDQDLTSYSRTQLDLHGVYGLSPALTVFARFSISTSKFETTTTPGSDTTNSGVEGLQGSASGFGDQAIGANYRFREFGDKNARLRKTSLDFQLQLDFPFYDTAGNRKDEKPLQGDGTTDLTLSPFLTMPLNQGAGNRLYLMAGLGYTARTKGYSAVIPYQLSVVMLPEKDGFMVRGGLYGYKALKSDADPTTSDSASGATVRDAGGSAIVDATNSSYIAGRVIAGYQTAEASQYYVGFTTLLSGKSTAALTAYNIGAQFRWARKSAGSASVSRHAGRENPSPAAVRYDLQAQVTKAKSEMKLAQINRGTADGVEAGQTFDFFRMDGGHLVVVARGTVTKAAGKAANISIQTYYQQAMIQPGFLARRVAP